MPKKKIPDPPPGAPAWMTTYGDMVTLLLTFFVLLYSFSVIDKQKYVALANSLKGALGGNVGVLNQGTSVEPSGELTSVAPTLKQVFNQLQKVLSKNGLEGKVEVTNDKRGVVISFKEKLFFEIGSADIITEAYPILNQVGEILINQKYPIRIEGHTCDLPIRNSRFPSNWELSAIRAINVTRYLIDKVNLNPEQVSTAAYGQYQPLVPNINEENRIRNRRVDIVIINIESKN